MYDSNIQPLDHVFRYVVDGKDPLKVFPDVGWNVGRIVLPVSDFEGEGVMFSCLHDSVVFCGVAAKVIVFQS